MAKGEMVLNPAESRVARALAGAQSALEEAAAAIARDADQILARVEAGENNSQIAATYGIRGGALWRILVGLPGMREAYDDAKRSYADRLVSEAHGLADRVVEGEIDPKRIDPKVRLAQWHAPRLSPEQYAERRQVEHTHTVKLDAADLAARLEQLMQVANQRAAITIDHEEITQNSQQAQQ